MYYEQTFIYYFFTSLDKTDVDERLNKDMTDYIMLRIGKSSTIQNNITPTMVKLDATPPETR